MIEVVLDFKEVFIEDDVALDLKEMRIKEKYNATNNLDNKFERISF